MHTANSLAALAANRHVLVEKPMAEKATDARRMADAAVSANRILAIGHSFRHSAAVRYLQDHFADFGVLQSLEVSQCVFWDGPQAPWWATRSREQGLILSLFAPHALDFVQLVMRDEPQRVHVETARHQSGWQGDDEAMILLGYCGRRMATVHVSYNQRRVVDRKTLLVGTPEGPGPEQRRMGGNDMAACFATQLTEFARAIRGQPHRSVLHEDGYRLIATIDRIRSAALASNPLLD